MFCLCGTKYHWASVIHSMSRSHLVTPHNVQPTDTVNTLMESSPSHLQKTSSYCKLQAILKTQSMLGRLLFLIHFIPITPSIILIFPLLM